MVQLHGINVHLLFFTFLLLSKPASNKAKQSNDTMKTGSTYVNFMGISIGGY